MAKRRRDEEGGGAGDASSEYNVVFVDTSLDTHLAILVSNCDTVSDFKKKMQLEHMQCFPKIGEIQIQSLKVKRGANFYHLPDVVPVWSAFHGENGNWFLSADVSSTEDDVEIDGMNIDDNCKRLAPDIKGMHNLSIFFRDGASRKNIVADKSALLEVQKSLETITASQSNNFTEANSMSRKKRKVGHAVVVYQNPTSKESCTLLLESGKVTSMPKIIGSGDSMSGAGKEGSEGLHLYEQQVKPSVSKAIAEVSAIMSYQSDIEKRGRSDRASSLATSEKSISGSMNKKHLVSNMKKQESRSKSTLFPENFVINEPEQEPGHNQMDAIGDAIQDADSNEKKMQKTQIGKVGNIMPNTETLICQARDEGSSLKHDSELLLPSMCKSPEHAEPALMLEKASFSLPSFNANASVGPEISSGSKKKKKKRRDNKCGNASLVKLAAHQKHNIVNVTSGSLCPSPDRTATLGKKKNSILYHEMDDSPMKFLDGAAIHANVKVHDADRGGDDPILLTEQMVVDMVNVKENMEENSQYETKMPALERQNQVMEFDPVEDKKNRVGKDMEPRKKRKKSKHSASDSQVKMPVRDKKFDNVVLENKENSVKDSVEEGRHAATSQFLSKTSDERLEELHGTPGNTNDLAIVNNELFPGTSLSNRPDHEPVKELTTDCCASASVELTNNSSRLLGTTAALRETKSDGNKKRKKKLLKDILDTTSTDQSGKVESKFATRVLSEVHDPELIMPLNCKSSEHDGPSLMPEKESFSPSVSDANAIVGPEITSGSKKKLKTGKKCADLNPKVHVSNRDTTDFVMTNQNKQIVEDVATGKEKIGEKTRWEEEIPDTERENQVLEFNQADKENSTSKDTKPIKKKKKTKSSVSNIQVNLPVKDQRVDNEVLANEGKSNGIKNSEEEEGGHVGTSQLLSQKNDEVLENEGEEINFRLYFVHGEAPCKVDSVDMVKRSSELNGEMKSGEIVKEKRSCSRSSSIEPSLVNQKKKDVSRVRKASGLGQGDSVQNSDWDEVISNSSTVPLRDSQTEVNDSSLIHRDAMNVAPKGPISNEIASPRRKENSTALEKSSSRRPELLIEKKSNKRSQSGPNATSRMVAMKPPKKSLLTKSGSIFQDDSGESSADENEKVQSDYSTLGPTNNSSESGYSDGESDESQDSSRNGSNEGTGRSKATQKLDLSGSNGMTMDMILKSSDRFRKAKLVASSQTEAVPYDSQQVELVPESEPIE